ncbi:hypothetical protein GGX14DRAFT_385589 [Mycena pura]|uniref:Ubiquitin-like domain-containing protein n=1 Tax=Mycena pura TaxID=153505 RepID=A0AAD6YQX3_9AGAR|nr:hypothetical protein GGX14DRAFT_385589 [Mycena pura]
MPLVAAALTFGSFGDILEAARIAKRIIDVLRKGGGSREHQRIILTLNGLCEDMAMLTVVDEGHFSIRLQTEIDLCRSLMTQFYAEIKSHEGPLRWVWGVVSEEKELASWRLQISARRAALHDVLGSLIVLMSTFLSAEVSRLGSEIRQLGSDVRQISKISPHDISDPVFFVMDPLGKPITIQLSRCDSFNALDRILKAYLCNHPEAGSRYVERGDYSIVSSEGVIIPRLKLGEKFRAGIQFEMSIIKRRASRMIIQRCPHGHINAGAGEGSWANCWQPTCGARFQVAKLEASAPNIEEISSPQISQQNPAEFNDRTELEDRKESFRLVQMFYVGDNILNGFINRTNPLPDSSSRRKGVMAACSNCRRRKIKLRWQEPGVFTGDDEQGDYHVMTIGTLGPTRTPGL